MDELLGQLIALDVPFHIGRAVQPARVPTHPFYITIGELEGLRFNAATDDITGDLPKAIEMWKQGCASPFDAIEKGVLTAEGELVELKA